MDKAIVVSNLTKKYKLYKNSTERLLDLLTPMKFGEDFYALANVNFEANVGEVIGFIGINGSGKSTLSNIIAGIVPETSGTVTTSGQVALIAVAAGLNNELTGRDNIELKLLMLGFSKEEIKELEPEIIEFSELDQFIDQPVKSYSSGMKSRLGFSISVNVNPDILIIDEALSVGDRAFAEKSLKKMKEFKEQGKTMIFVSHSLSQMREFCDKLLWLEFGMVKDYGSVEDILPKYISFLDKWKLMSKKERLKYREHAFKIQQKMVDGETVVEKPNIDDFIEIKTQNEITEKPVSLLGHIRSGDSFIYNSPYDLNRKIHSNKYKNKVYYIKKQVVIEGKKYYLLSTKPSGIKGTIGWMDSANLSVHRHVHVDLDPKEMTFKGTGIGYNHPWGGKKDIVISNFKPLRGEKFSISRTDLVGNNVWYKGTFDGKEFWLHEKHLE